MQHSWTWRKRSTLWSGSLLLLLLFLLAACGGSATGTSSASLAVQHTAAGSASGQQQVSNGPADTAAQPQAATQGKSPNTSSAVTPQYLIKTLKVGMSVQDTRKVARDIQAWIATTDPRSSTAGADYEQAGDNLYNVTLQFSVQASLYPQIYGYLRDYASNLGTGSLQSFTETVQDVSNDYVDTQSRLKNLRVEQQRIQTLMSQAQAIGDVLTIEQKLTDVEGQIDSIESHLNQLNSQVTYYNVTLTLQPIQNTTPPTPAPTGWSGGQIFRDAFAASLAFAQGLASILIWLFAFSFYIIPAGLIAWLIWRVRNHPRRTAPAPTKPYVPPTSDEE